MSEIEDRVDRVEDDVQELRHISKVRHDALGDALNRTHADLLAFREETRDNFADVRSELSSINAALREVLDRLPPRDQT